MESNVELVTNSFRRDVLTRGVVNSAAPTPCECGLYQYYSQKCGCLYKSVHLKCGNTLSENTGMPILCRAGRGRKVRVHDAVVPFHCAECRRKNVRWTGRSAEIKGGQS
ncbi:hypothetical protein Hte_004342 [Hypoxylon texense]